MGGGPGFLSLKEEGLRTWTPGSEEEGLGTWTPGSEEEGLGTWNPGSEGGGAVLLEELGVGSPGFDKESGWGPELRTSSPARVQNPNFGRKRPESALQYPCCQSEDGAGSQGVERPGWGFRARF